jgi:hypothetical protein
LTNDQTNSAEASRGLGNSPVGAQIQANTDANFNIGWQQQQLQNQIAGGNAAGSLNTQGLQAMSQAPGYTMASGQIPLQAQQNAAAAPGQAANTYSQGITNSMNPYASQLNSLSSYLGLGQGASGGAFSGLQNSQNQQAMGMQGLLSGMNGLGNSGGNSWLSSLFGGSGSSSPYSGQALNAMNPSYGYASPL